MHLPSGERSTAWVKRFSEVVSSLNNELTSLTGVKPADANDKQDVFPNRRQNILCLSVA